MPRYSKTTAEKNAKRSVNAARKVLGSGWKHVSLELRRGLVNTEILNIILGQDESLPATTVLGYLRELVQAADAILDGEE